jgi:hypothetical protein
MSELMNALIIQLDRAMELIRHSGASSYGGPMTNRRMVNAVADLKYHLAASGNIDLLKARQVFAPTGALQEIAMENDWGSDFIQISIEVNEILDRMRALEKVP